MSDFREDRASFGGSIEAMLLDDDFCYRAVSSRDARFDGHFVVAVHTTGIYCRPSCPAMTPKAANVSFFRAAAAAQRAGYRACRRCLPDAVPGSPEWDVRSDVAARAMRLIADGVIERAGVPGLATQLGYSTRQLGRVLTTELGAGPLALARAHRARAARVLIETSALPFTDVAFAAGFDSVRQFNATIQEAYATTPSELRSRALRREAPSGASGALALRLPFRTPFAAAELLRFFADRAIGGIENVSTTTYARTMRLPHATGTVHLVPDATHIDASVRLADLRDLAAAVSRLRRLFDLDADPQAVDEVLGADPALAPMVASAAGIRVPGCTDEWELLVRAVLGQQVSVAAARTTITSLTAALGERLPEPDGGLTHLFPTPESVAERGRSVLTGPRRRIDTIVRLAEAVSIGKLDIHIGRDPRELRDELEAVPGVGAWTAGYVVTRVLGSPDELLSTDAALRRGAAALRIPSDLDRLAAYGRRWQPWRSYAGMHLWRATTSS